MAAYLPLLCGVDYLLHPQLGWEWGMKLIDLWLLCSGICSTKEIQWENGVIDFYPLHFLFPTGGISCQRLPSVLFSGTQKVNMLVEGQAEIKMFCKDYVQRAEVMFILSTVSCLVVVLSLVQFLMSLSANYAHIKGHDKFTDLKVNNLLSKNYCNAKNIHRWVYFTDANDKFWGCLHYLFIFLWGEQKIQGGYPYFWGCPHLFLLFSILRSSTFFEVILFVVTG